jgi:sialic acid synthase SpsE
VYSMPVLVIAEVGSVHDGSFGNAQNLIDVAAQCCADGLSFKRTLLPLRRCQCAHAALFSGRAALQVL